MGPMREVVTFMVEAAGLVFVVAGVWTAWGIGAGLAACGLALLLVGLTMEDHL